MDKNKRLKVIIYGAFDAGKYIAERLGANVEIVGFADSSETKSKLGFEGYSVWNIEGLKNVDVDKIIIAAKSYKAITSELKKAGLESRIYRDPALNNIDIDKYDHVLHEILALQTVAQHLQKLKHTAASENGAFSFGRNWEHFVDTAIDNNVYAKHATELAWWIESPVIKGKRVIDIGCGSGITALNLSHMGCRELIAFDYDEYSVKATRKLFQSKSATNENVEIMQGSILDNEFVDNLGQFDLVHSWGVLHHTGNMQLAINNAMSLCSDNGFIMIALYESGPRYEKDLALKKAYNKASDTEKLSMLASYLEQKNFRYKYELEVTNQRGMNPLHDAIDWLGGYPYEVSHYKTVINNFSQAGFELRKFKYKPEGGCSIFVFQKDLNGL